MRSRDIAVITFTITATGPMSVGDPLHEDVVTRIASTRLPGEHPPEGAADPEEPVDVPISRDPWGNPIVRGTSVFGAMRAHLSGYVLTPKTDVTLRSIRARGHATTSRRPASLADLACGSEPEELAQPEPGTDGAVSRRPALRPSALRLVAVNVTRGDSSDGQVRTAVSRQRGSARAHKLYRRAELLNASISVVLQVDMPLLGEALAHLCLLPATRDQALSDLVLALAEWTPTIGGRVGWGWGNGKLEALRWGGLCVPVDRLLEADSTVSLMASIATSRKRPTSLVLCEAPSAPSRWSLEVRLRCADPLLVSAVVEAPGQGGPRNAARGRDRVSGSTWRGLLRSRSEFIARSCGLPACDSSDETCGRCLTCALFGWSPAPGEPADRIGAAGLVRFSDSVVEEPRWLTLTHAPVDRFTGGARDQRLFVRTSVAPGAELTLSVMQRSAGRPVPTWAQSLIALAVRDLVDGLVGVGGSTTRGYGTMVLAPEQPAPPVAGDWLEHARTAASGMHAKGGA